MFNLFKKKTIAIHEPLELQIADVKKMSPLVVDTILAGEDCDNLINGIGEFGNLNNPIPVNGLLGIIKYLGKLRGKTGHAVFFHRIGSFKSTATKHPVDKYELVCLDNTQWTYLFFDLYHPRRSNKCPEGFSLVPYNEQLKMDNPFAYGVDYLVNNFPYSLETEIDKYYGETDTFGRHARKWLEQYKFERPIEHEDSGIDGAMSVKVSQNSKKSVSNNSPLEIEHYSFISGVINEIIELEKELIKNNSASLFGFSCPQIFEKANHIRFMIERYLFICSNIRTFNTKINLSGMDGYIASIISKEYNISSTDSLLYMERRIQFYVRELEMLSTFKHPHPGKIVWSLYNPTVTDISDDLDSMFEPNIFAGMQLMDVISDTFIEEYKKYSESNPIGFNNSKN